MNIHARSRIGDAQDFFFEVGGLAVGVAEFGRLVHFEMQLDEKMAFVIMCGQFVNCEAAALRDRANCFEQRLVVSGARLDVDNHVRRDNAFDVALDCVAGCMRLFKARSARHADGHVHEITLAGTTDANALGLQYTLGFVHGVRNLLA